MTVFVRRRFCAATLALAAASVIAVSEPAHAFYPSPVTRLKIAFSTTCNEIRALQTVSDVNTKEGNLDERLGFTEAFAANDLAKKQKELETLKVRVQRAENDALVDLLKTVEDLDKKAKENPLLGVAAEVTPDDVAEKAEKVMIDDAFKGARDTGTQLSDASLKVHEAKAILAAIRAIRFVIATCAEDQRNLLKFRQTPPDGARFANGVDPTLKKTAAGTRSVAGTYIFKTCVGDGTNWAKASGVLLRVTPGGSVEGMVMFRSQKLPLSGSVGDGGAFRAEATDNSGGRTYQVVLSGHLTGVGTDALALADASITAGDSSENVCTGAVSK